MQEFIQTYFITPFINRFAPEEKLNWIFLLLTVVIAAIIYLFQFRKQNSYSLIQLKDFIFPARIYKNQSSRTDVYYFIVDTLLRFLIITPFIVYGVQVGDQLTKALNAVFGEFANPVFPSELVVIYLTFFFVVAYDLSFYLAHRLLHKIGFLWEFHKVHHSAEVLNPLTLFREHPVDQLVNGAFAGIATGLVLGLFDYFTATPVRFSGAVWITGFLFIVAGGHFRHMEIWISYGKYFNLLFISPAHHQIHHSCDQKHKDKNFGGIFSFWDGLFCSLYMPVKPEKLVMGLTNDEHKNYHNVCLLYCLPFANLYRKIFKS